MFSAIAVSSPVGQLPKGVKVVARIPLEGSPVTHMYTQWENGHTYLYLEHGAQSLTTVDVTKARSPRLVEREPAKVEPIRYLELFDGGTVEDSSGRHVYAGIDNRHSGSWVNILQNSDPDDAKLLEAFGQATRNLADRDSRVVYVASPAQLMILQDNRWTRIDVTN